MTVPDQTSSTTRWTGSDPARIGHPQAAQDGRVSLPNPFPAEENAAGHE